MCRFRTAASKCISTQYSGYGWDSRRGPTGALTSAAAFWHRAAIRAPAVWPGMWRNPVQRQFIPIRLPLASARERFTLAAERAGTSRLPVTAAQHATGWKGGQSCDLSCVYSRCGCRRLLCLFASFKSAGASSHRDGEPQRHCHRRDVPARIRHLVPGRNLRA